MSQTEQQAITAQENKHIREMIAQTEAALEDWQKAGQQWEAEQTDQAGAALDTAKQNYEEACCKLAAQIASLYRTGYELCLPGGDNE